MNNIQKNAERFKGFADIYDRARPSVPLYPVRVILRYLGNMPETVVDLGSGTGLSTVIWRDYASQIIGIEPSGDMRAAAQTKADDKVSFREGYGNATGLPDGCADAVVCSQSFHWMEPVSTLKEVDRILKNGGVFATIDCEWPPVASWEAEKAYMDLYGKVKKLEKELPDVADTFTRYDKDKHLENIKKSGYFRYTRELLFANTEKCDARRLIDLVLSQGSTQTVLRLHPDKIVEDIRKFEEKVTDLLGDTEFTVDFSYKMRIGVK